jgi:NhaA family Na+:H+ antiporter
MINDLETLPHEAADSITKPFARFLKIEAAAGALLLLAVLLALALAVAFSSPFQYVIMK